eukprot:366195-Chlamydomonas_euryale.AAC.8
MPSVGHLREHLSRDGAADEVEGAGSQYWHTAGIRAGTCLDPRTGLLLHDRKPAAFLDIGRRLDVHFIDMPLKAPLATLKGTEMHEQGKEEGQTTKIQSQNSKPKFKAKIQRVRAALYGKAVCVCQEWIPGRAGA